MMVLLFEDCHESRDLNSGQWIRSLRMGTLTLKNDLVNTMINTNSRFLLGQRPS